MFYSGIAKNKDVKESWEEKAERLTFKCLDKSVLMKIGRTIQFNKGQAVGEWKRKFSTLNCP